MTAPRYPPLYQIDTRVWLPRAEETGLSRSVPVSGRAHRPGIRKVLRPADCRAAPTGPARRPVARNPYGQLDNNFVFQGIAAVNLSVAVRVQFVKFPNAPLPA